MTDTDARLLATWIAHLGTAVANDTLNALMDILGLPRPLDPITWTDSEIDELVNDLTTALRQEKRR